MCMLMDDLDVHTLHTVENYIPFTVTLPGDINRSVFTSYYPV